MNIKTNSITTKAATFIAMVAFSISPLTAQTYHPSRDYGASSFRANVGITIPLGGDKKQALSKPRVDFGFQQSRIEQEQLKLDFNRYSLQQAPIVHRNIGRVGFTLDQNPQMIVNGKSYRIDGEQKNVSTLGLVGIVAGTAAAIVVVGLVVIATNPRSDDG